MAQVMCSYWTHCNSLLLEKKGGFYRRRMWERKMAGGGGPPYSLRLNLVQDKFKFHLKLASSKWKPVYLEQDPSKQNSKLASSGWKLVHLQWESVLKQIKTCIFRMKNGRFLNQSRPGWRWDHSDGYGRFLNRSRQGWRCNHCHGHILNRRRQGWSLHAQQCRPDLCIGTQASLLWKSFFECGCFHRRS